MCLATSIRKPVYKDITKLRVIDLSQIEVHTYSNCQQWVLPLTMPFTDTDLRFPGLPPAFVTSSGAAGMIFVFASLFLPHCMPLQWGRNKKDGSFLSQTKQRLLFLCPLPHGPPLDFAALSPSDLLPGHHSLRETLGKRMLSRKPGILLPT